MAISILDILFAILMFIVTSFVGAFIVWLIQDGKGVMFDALYLFKVV